MANTRPMIVSPSAVIPARWSPWPTGSSPRSTVARQRPSSMRSGSSVGEQYGWNGADQANTRRETPSVPARGPVATTCVDSATSDPFSALGGAGGGQDVPDGEDPQRGPG